MSEYGQKLRVFVIGCPSGDTIRQNLLAKINEAANKFDTLQNSHDDLLAALERLFNDCRNEPAELQRQKAMQKAAEAIAKAKK